MDLQNEVNTTLGNKTDSTVMANMILLLMGRLVSLFGSQIYNFAISLYVLKTTGSSAAFSITLVFGMLPRIIFGSVAGVVSDRVDRKKLVVAMDILSGVVVFGLVTMAYLDGLKVSYIYIANLLLNTCNTFFDIPMGASIPNIVDDKNLVKMNSLNHAVSSMAQIAGPFLGGLVFAFVDMKLFLIINASSFVISGVSEMFINFNLNNKPIEEAEEVKNINGINRFLEEFKEGIKFIRSSKVLTMVFSFSIFINFFVSLGILVPYPYIINNVLMMSPTKFGILEAMLPLGMLLGSVAMSIFPEREKKHMLLIIGIMILSIVCILLGMPVVPKLMVFSNTTYFIYYIIFLLIGGISVICANIPTYVIMQRETPDNIRGRIFGLLETLCIGISPIGLILSGLIIEKAPVYILPVFSGIVMVIITIKMATNKEIKTI